MEYSVWPVEGLILKKEAYRPFRFSVLVAQKIERQADRDLATTCHI